MLFLIPDLQRLLAYDLLQFLQVLFLFSQLALCAAGQRFLTRLHKLRQPFFDVRLLQIIGPTEIDECALAFEQLDHRLRFSFPGPRSTSICPFPSSGVPILRLLVLFVVHMKWGTL